MTRTARGGGFVPTEVRRTRLPTGLVVFAMIAVLAALVFVRLGLWQLGRHAERRDAAAMRSARLAEPPIPLDSLWRSIRGSGQASVDALEWRRVVVSGQWVTGADALVRNRAFRGRAGVHVVTPLVVSAQPAAGEADARAVLVLRGWLPARDATTPAGQVRVAPGKRLATADAVVRRSRAGAGAPVVRVAAGQDTLPSLAAVDVDRIWSEVGEGEEATERIRDVFLQLLPPPEPSGTLRTGIPIPAPLPEPGNGPHLVYAVQWFSFALVALGGAYFFVRHRRRELSAANAASRRSR